MIPAQHFYDPETNEVLVIVVDPETGEQVAADVRLATPRSVDVKAADAARAALLRAG